MDHDIIMWHAQNMAGLSSLMGPTFSILILDLLQQYKYKQTMNKTAQIDFHTKRPYTTSINKNDR